MSFDDTSHPVCYSSDNLQLSHNTAPVSNCVLSAPAWAALHRRWYMTVCGYVAPSYGAAMHWYVEKYDVVAAVPNFSFCGHGHFESRHTYIHHTMYARVSPHLLNSELLFYDYQNES